MISPRHQKTVDRVLRAIRSEVHPGEYVSTNELRRRIFDRVQVSKSELSAIIRIYGLDLFQIYRRQDQPRLVCNYYQVKPSDQRTGETGDVAHG